MTMLVINHGSIKSFLLLLLFFFDIVVCFETSSRTTNGGVSRNEQEVNEKQKQHRNLAQPLLGGTYEPATVVSDLAAIDLDLMEISEHLGATSESNSFFDARKVYDQGANALPYAYIGVTTPLVKDYPMGTPVAGNSTLSGPVTGTLMLNASRGETFILVRYSPARPNHIYIGCRVGGSSRPVLSECFHEDGEIWVGPDVYGYDYNPNTENLNSQTIREFSSKAQAEMYSCEHCPYDDYEKFYNYYGKYDYADEFIRVAFEQGYTDFARGNANFNTFTRKPLQNVIETSAVILNTWMYVIKEMESAIDSCTDHKCSTLATGLSLETCQDEDMVYDVQNWDRAVALYVGSSQVIPTDSEGPVEASGQLLYNLANVFCVHFGTCGEGGGHVRGPAQVNFEILWRFTYGKEQLLSGNCNAARNNKKQIVNLMKVPLIQGALQYAFLEERHFDLERQGLGAIYAASVLPMVYSCSDVDAVTIHENLRAYTLHSTNFTLVKATLEKNYECMGVSCQLIGGQLRRNGRISFIPGAEPCGEYALPEEPSFNRPTVAPLPPPSSSVNSAPSVNVGSSTSSTSTSSSATNYRRPYAYSARRNFDLATAIGAAVLVLLAGFVVLMLCRTWKPTPIIQDEENYGIEIRQTSVMNGDPNNNYGTNNDNMDEPSFSIT